MKKIYSSDYPIKVERNDVGYKVSYNIRKATSEEVEEEWLASGRAEMEGNVPTMDFINEHVWVYNIVSVPMGKWRYDMVVDAIVRDKYRSDEMEAMTNNMAAINAVFMQTLVSDGIIAATKYLKDSIDDVNTQNFKAMQEWRAMAKREAKEVFG